MMENAMSDDPEQMPSDPSDPLAFEEPLFDPNDTPPHGVRVPPAPPTHPSLLRRPQAIAPAARADNRLTSLTLGAALLITLIAAVLYFVPSEPAPAPLPTQSADLPTRLPPTLPMPTATPDQPAQPVQPVRYDQDVPIDVVAEHLLRPAEVLPPQGALYRAQNPYTIAPARGRSEIVQYRIQPGDTLEKIAARFGISQDTIIWNNDGIFVNRFARRYADHLARRRCAASHAPRRDHTSHRR
jgi:LysM repeat protein